MEVINPNPPAGGGVGGGHTIQEEGVSLTQRGKINFTGLGGTATDDAGNDATIYNNPGVFETMQAHGDAGAAETIDWSTGGMHSMTLTADCTVTFTAPPAARGHLYLKVTQDANGPWNITWPATVYKVQSVAYDATQEVNKIDMFIFAYDGTNYYPSMLPNLAL